MIKMLRSHINKRCPLWDPASEGPAAHQPRQAEFLPAFIYLFILSFYPDSVYLRGVVYPYSSISAFNDPTSLCAAPPSLVLWLYLYFGEFVCIVSGSVCN